MCVIDAISTIIITRCRKKLRNVRSEKLWATVSKTKDEKNNKMFKCKPDKVNYVALFTDKRTHVRLLQTPLQWYENIC